MNIARRLAELGLKIPEPPAPVANYVPHVRVGPLLFLAGQVSSGPSGLIKGRLGADLSTEEGAEAAKLCAVNLIAQMRAGCAGDLDRVRQIVKIVGFVNCTPDFVEHPKVINGASDLFVAVFGDAGRHARAAVGAPSLPLGAAVEIDAVVEIE
jgi:enamine deaminase RidA (YjgF/YER057c/UK114 family)